jgi:hypothetical protein
MSSRNSQLSEIKNELGIMDMPAINSLVGLLQLPKLGSGPRNQAKAVCLFHGLTVEDYDKHYNNPVSSPLCLLLFWIAIEERFQLT